MMAARRFLIIIIVFIALLSTTEALSQTVKGQSMRMYTISLSGKKVAQNSLNKPVIGFIALQPYEKSTDEIKRAFDFLKGFDLFSAEYITMKELEKQSKSIDRFSLLWVHRPDSGALSDGQTNSQLIRILKSYTEHGGRLLLSLRALHYLNDLGFESQPLQDSIKKCSDDGYGRRLGFHAFREHPLFTGLNGGAYLCRPSSDLATGITGFFGNYIPQQGKVIAVDWDYIFLREESKMVLEYTPGKGKVLAVGGYMNFSLLNANSAHLDLFTLNCFRYLLDQYAGQPRFYWNYAPRQVTGCPAPVPTDQMLVAVSPSAKWDEHSSDIDLKRRFASENFWDVAGERMLTMGTERGGIEEIWAHPFMALRDYEVGIKFAYRDSVFWLRDERPGISVNPAYFSRQYKFPRAYLKELVVNDPTEPNGVIHYEYRGVYPAELIIRFKSNLRWMWPYSDQVTGSMCHSWDYDLDAFNIQDQSGDLNLVIGGTKKPVQHLSGQFEGFNYNKADSSFHGIPTGDIEVAALLSYKLEMNDNLDVVFSATSEGYAATKSHFSTAVHDPGRIYRNAMRHSLDILSKKLMITTPDQDFNTGYRWSLLAADRFFVNTPGMGSALVAGYSTTRNGWDGGHKVNGRPGYGWYFGRDAEWSSFALLDYGDFAKVKSQLEFFNKYQDLNGKILHEASTSGLIHYDAADATPLYVVLAGRYFRYTNDTAFLRRTWPNVKRAINFCFSTDTDRDHLIENTNVGHGWVEGGELYGSHATIYMAGSWGAALNEASNMARFMKDIEADSYRVEAEEQAKIIDSDFWSDQQQYFAYGKNIDGSFRREQTILPAVPVYFRMTDRDKSSLALKYVAGNAFSTNWGVRILRDDSPLFKPSGYHYGSVWPLFTGWASLAEYSTGNPIQGFFHLMNNLDVYKNWGLGFVEEVLNGAEYKPSGVCAHQCWSETMVLQPAIEGMLGLDVKAQEHKICLSPQVPPQWDSLHVENIRMADQLAGFYFKRTGGTVEYRFSLDHGAPVHVEFMPCFPAGTGFFKVSLNGKEIPFTTFKSPRAMTLIVSFELRSASNLVVETEAGISALPVIAEPKPGDAAEGMRILSANLEGNVYNVEVEGKAGSSGILEIWSGRPDLLKSENAKFINQSGHINRFSIDFGRTGLKYVTKIIGVNLK